MSVDLAVKLLFGENRNKGSMEMRILGFRLGVRHHEKVDLGELHFLDKAKTSRETKRA